MSFYTKCMLLLSTLNVQEYLRRCIILIYNQIIFICLHTTLAVHLDMLLPINHCSLMLKEDKIMLSGGSVMPLQINDISANLYYDYLNRPIRLLKIRSIRSLLPRHAHAQQGLRDWSWCPYIYI